MAELSAPSSLSARRVPAASTSLIHRIMSWLMLHRRWHVILTAAYLFFIVTAHDIMQQPAYWVQDRLGSRRTWDIVVTIAAAPFLAGVAVWMVAALRCHPRKAVSLIYVIVTLGIASLFFRFLIMVNIEIIHYPQYAILAVLLFPYTQSHGQTIVWALLVALVDEGYQYLVLYPERRIYMDFNDVILNIVGTGFGLVAIFLSGAAAASLRPLMRSLAGRAFLLVAGLSAIAWVCGWIRLLPEGAAGWAVPLRRAEPPSEFWTPNGGGGFFHQVLPMEWVCVSILLVVFYACLDRFHPRAETA